MWSSGCFACFFPFVFFFRRLLPKLPTINRDWGSDIPPDVLEVISDRLPLRDFITFRSVCRHWRSSPSGRSQITNFSKQGEDRPWLMFYGFQDSICYLYSHPHRTCCTVRLPDLDHDATVMESKSNWLFVRRRKNFFLLNIFTLAKTDLPDHEVYEDQACTMTGRTVFIVSRTNDSNMLVSFCRVGSTTWDSHTTEISKAHLGTLLAIAACDCADGGHKEDSCGLTDEMHISISGSRKRLVYNYAQKSYFEVVDRQTRKVSHYIFVERRFREVSLDDDFEGFREYFINCSYRRDWMEKFGEKGISVSISATRIRTDEMRRDAIVGIRRYTRVIKGDGELSTKLTPVKASWIEPSFV